MRCRADGKCFAWLQGHGARSLPPGDPARSDQPYHAIVDIPALAPRRHHDVATRVPRRTSAGGLSARNVNRAMLRPCAVADAVGSMPLNLLLPPLRLRKLPLLLVLLLLQQRLPLPP